MDAQGQSNQAAGQSAQPTDTQQTQPQSTNVGQNGSGTAPPIDQSSIPQQLPMNTDGAFMNFDPNAMAGLMPNQMLPDQSMAGMGIADPSIMVPMMLPNGGATLPPNGVSAGMCLPSSTYEV